MRCLCPGNRAFYGQNAIVSDKKRTRIRQYSQIKLYRFFCIMSMKSPRSARLLLRLLRSASEIRTDLPFVYLPAPGGGSARAMPGDRRSFGGNRLYKRIKNATLYITVDFHEQEADSLYRHAKRPRCCPCFYLKKAGEDAKRSVPAGSCMP